jgi:hypothetical protein
MPATTAIAPPASGVVEIAEEDCGHSRRHARTTMCTRDADDAAV